MELEIINAAFSRLKELEFIYGASVPNAILSQGFYFNGETIHFRSNANGIFKPAIMNNVVLSIKTTYDDPYDDEEGDDEYLYSFEEGQNEYRNNYLRNAYKEQSPFIYFKAVAHAIYQCIWPCYVQNIDEVRRKFIVVVGERSIIHSAASTIEYERPKEIETKYYVRDSKVRGHQEAFKNEVIEAYGEKCAISGLNDRKLLHAAHILPDAEIVGMQSATCGIALNHLHHKAFDTYLIGIDQDYKIHVSDKLKSLSGGKLLDPGLISYDKETIRLPRNPNYHPDRDLLKQKYERYLSHN